MIGRASSRFSRRNAQTEASATSRMTTAGHGTVLARRGTLTVGARRRASAAAIGTESLVGAAIRGECTAGRATCARGLAVAAAGCGARARERTGAGRAARLAAAATGAAVSAACATGRDAAGSSTAAVDGAATGGASGCATAGASADGSAFGVSIARDGRNGSGST